MIQVPESNSQKANNLIDHTAINSQRDAQEKQHARTMRMTDSLLTISGGIGGNSKKIEWTEPQLSLLQSQISAYKYACRGLPVPPEVIRPSVMSPEAWLAQRQAIQKSTYDLYQYKYEDGEMVPLQFVLIFHSNFLTFATTLTHD